MASEKEMRSTMEEYLRLVGAGDVDGVVGLMADDVSVEDPVGGPAGTHVVGKEAVHAFFSSGFANSKPRPERTGPIRATAGDEAAMPFRLVLTLRGADKVVDVIDVMRFDDRGRIVSLRAFWNFAEMRDAT